MDTKSDFETLVSISEAETNPFLEAFTFLILVSSVNIDDIIGQTLSKNYFLFSLIRLIISLGINFRNSLFLKPITTISHLDIDF
jgi:hypothetical protein